MHSIYSKHPRPTINIFINFLYHLLYIFHISLDLPFSSFYLLMHVKELHLIIMQFFKEYLSARLFQSTEGDS
jgi:hypothetical protein